MNSANNFPENYIERSLHVIKTTSEISFSKKARSTYFEYTEENIWDDNVLSDVYNISKKILNLVMDDNLLSDNYLKNKRIVSIDIETTDFIPKAREGFVNTLGLSYLDLTPNSEKSCELVMHQSFNMLRKKEHARHLLDLAWEYINNSDILLVFNRSFDINILQTIINNSALPYKFPERIFDLRDKFKSLRVLEEYLNKKVGFQRIHSEKGKYKDYYKLFKGKGSKGLDKKLEPLGTYNLMDTLTPLYAYLLMEK